MKLVFIVIAVLCIIPHVSGYANGVEIDDVILVDYQASFVNETVFDQGTSVQLTVSYERLIPGFVDGVLGMVIGERKVFEIPPERGYTDPNNDLYNETLVFDVFLKDVIINNSTTSQTGIQSEPDLEVSNRTDDVVTADLLNFPNFVTFSLALAISALLLRRKVDK